MTLLSVLCGAAAAVLAQGTRVTDQHAHLWVSHWGDHRVLDRWSLHSEAHWRRAELGASAQQVLLRPAVNFHLNDQVMFTAGYSHYRNTPYGEHPARFANWEHNVYQQVQISRSIGRVRISDRLRLEQRFIARMRSESASEGNAVLDGYAYQNRLRFRLMASVPLGRDTDGKDGPFSLHVYDEVFLNFGDTHIPDHIQQNRVSALLGYRVNKPVQVMLGYLHQTIQRPGAAAGADLVEQNATLHLVVVCDLDLRKKKP